MRALSTIACVISLLACGQQDAPPGEVAAEPEAVVEKAPEQPAVEGEGAPAADPGADGDCTYAYDAAGTKLTWTSFKLAEKVGVPGSFDEITVSGTTDAPAPERVFDKASFTIKTASVNSGNPERDPKIAKSFFGTLKDGDTISGTVKAIGEGKGTLELTLGGVTRPVEMGYAVADDTFTATGTIDVVDFGGGAAIAALNEVCKLQHTGKDGSSKLWSEVELKVESKLTKTCK